MFDRRNQARGLFVVLALVAASCAQIVGLEEGVLRDDAPAPECSTIADCEATASECKTALACTEGKCEYSFALRGTRPSTQIIGDCRDVVCDGNGATEIVVTDVDVEDDHNDCTADSCNAGTPAHAPIPGKILICYDGLAGTAGVGPCKEGTRACDSQGKPATTCDGQVVPEAELCGTMLIDENCNGMTNETGPEGGTCQCGDGATSPGIGEACDDGNFAGGDGCSPLCSDVQVEQLYNHGLFSCVRTNKGTVKCWGANSLGALGIGSTNHIGDAGGEMGASLTEVPLGTGKYAVDLGLGSTFACAILNDETLRCWGDNAVGQLGEGTAMPRGDAPAEMGDAMPVINLGPGLIPKKVVGGKAFTCALMDNGSVKCWGANGAGQLGLGDKTNRGSAPTSMGANLPFVQLGTGRTAKVVEAGDNFTCVILDDDTVKCWGLNDMGQLGLGDTTIRGGMPGEMGDNLPVVNLGMGKTAKRIALGNAHACVILNDDTVKCWGQNTVGQVGLGDTQNRGDGPSEMGDALPAIDLGTGRIAIAIDAGLQHSCAVLDDGSLKCWGWGANGQLGIGDNLARGNEAGEMGNALLPIDLGMGRKALAVQAADSFTCALLDDTSVKCWGFGDFGRLGYGDTMQRGDKIGQMGINLPIVKLFSDTW